MSGLNPGGSRKVGGRVFNPSAIARICSSKQVPGIDKPSTSIADKPHQSVREQARAARRKAAAEAKAAKRNKL